VTANDSLIFSATYDYRTRRLTTITNGITTFFQYDSGDCFAEYAANGSLNVQYMRGSGMGGGIGSILYSNRNGKLEYFDYNGVGDTVLLTDPDCVASDGILYDAYGNIVASSGSSANNRLAFTKERDFSIGLDNHGMRYYDPEIGRYISRDPAGYVDSLNVYLYVHNNPINHIDPLGLNDTFGLGTFGDLALPDPVANYQGGRAQADILFNPNASALEHFGAFLGVAGYTAQAIVEWVPGEATVEKSVEKVAVKLAEEGGAKELEQAAVKGAEKKAATVAEKDAAKASEDAVSAEKGGKNLPDQAHHFATNKNKDYTPGFKEIADQYGLDLNKEWNKEVMPHLGRHPNDYHDFVEAGMSQAAREAGKDKEKFLKLYEEYVKKPIRDNPDLLRKSGWEKK